MLGLALHPDFPDPPYLYVLYTYDAPPGETAPYWNDLCPTPPGATLDGCVVTGRLSRLEIGQDGRPGGEQVLLADRWCQQFPSHSIGTVAFGPDGALYVGAGDGASFPQVDFGQLGGSLPDTPTLVNPCADPPAPAGQPLSPPTAEGGALRAQDWRTTADPLNFDGAVLRLDPESGAAMPRPSSTGGPPADPIIAYGLRNPYRFTFHPARGDLWIGDVGWRDWEEINRIVEPGTGAAENFGWPCFEGPAPQPEYAAAGLDLCDSLYEAPASVTSPYYAYRHAPAPDPAACGDGHNAAITGLAFYLGGDFPIAYHGALFFADLMRRCIWAMLPAEDGLPDPDRIITVVSDAADPVDLQRGPDGDLFYVDHLDGTIRRLAVAADHVFGDAFETGNLAAWQASQPDLSAAGRSPGGRP